MSTQTRSPGRKVTILDLQEMKRRGEKIAALTAYDYLLAQIVDAGGVDVILVGDSAARVIHGLEDELSITLDDIIQHARSVRRGVQHALVVVDLPFMSYQVSTEDALRNAGRIMKETGATAVKLEGGSPARADAIAGIIGAGIPVMAHLGYTPQATHALGGARVQGRDDAGRNRLLEEARRITDAGAFAVVLEMVPGGLAAEVTSSIAIPTIGIGAGAGCDGQILVLHDMLGLNRGFQPRFLRRFGELGDQAQNAVSAYVDAVRQGEYPAVEHTFE